MSPENRPPGVQCEDGTAGEGGANYESRRHLLSSVNEVGAQGPEDWKVNGGPRSGLNTR